MAETRSEKVSVVVTPAVLARLDDYRDKHHWTRSTAIAVLIEDGLDREEQKEASA